MFQVLSLYGVHTALGEKKEFQSFNLKLRKNFFVLR